MSRVPHRRGRALGLLLGVLWMAAGSLPGAAHAAIPGLAWSYPQLLGPASAFGESSSFTGLSCPSTALCAASDRDGSLLVTSRLASGVSAWQSVPLAPGGRLVGVSCPTTRLCVTAAEDGRVFATAQPLGGPGGWTQAAIGGMGLLTAVSCSPSGACAVVDDAGDVALSSTPLAGGWVVAQVDTSTRPCGGARCQSGFTTVACPTSQLCAAFDQVGNVAVSAAPFAGGSWRVEDVDYRGYGAAAPRPGCAGTFCVQLTCPSASSCVAVDSSGYVITSSDPAGPATAWVARPLEPLGGAPTALSCTSPSSCVLGDAGEELLVTGNPAGGAPAWRPAPFAPSAVAGDPQRLGILEGVACPGPQECLAVDDAGNLVLGLPAVSGRLVARSASAIAGFGPLPGMRELAGTGRMTIPFIAPQAGRADLGWRIEVTLPRRVVVTGRGKKRRRRVIPARPASISAQAQTLLLGPGPARLQLTLTDRARRLLRQATGGSLSATATVVSASGVSRTVTRVRSLHR